MIALCQICNTPGRACGPHKHVHALLTSDTIKGETMAEGGPFELKEYEYKSGHFPITAMLTEKQAAALGAVLVPDVPPTPAEPVTVAESDEPVVSKAYVPANKKRSP
jgi:hypothetical protein